MGLHDQLATSPATPTDMRNSCFAIIDAGQNNPAIQLRATSVALLAMCEALNVNVRELLTTSERLMRDLDSPFSSSIRAIKDYAQGELR